MPQSDPRREARDICRVKLCRHLRKPAKCHAWTNLIIVEETLNLDITPERVRLRTCAGDPYRWKVVEGKEHIFSRLFSKNLSYHSVTALRLLSREVGLSFFSVLPLKRKEHRIILPSNFTRSETDRLIESNYDLRHRVFELTSSLQQEVERRKCVENNYASVMARLGVVEQEAQYYSFLLGKLNCLFTDCFPALETIKEQLELRLPEPLIEPTTEVELI